MIQSAAFPERRIAPIRLNNWAEMNGAIFDKKINSRVFAFVLYHKRFEFFNQEFNE